MPRKSRKSDVALERSLFAAQGNAEGAQLA